MVLIVIALIVGLIVLGVNYTKKSLGAASKNASQKAEQKKEEAKQPPKEQKPPMELNISVNKTIYGIEITNKEPAPLTNCKIKLNDGYEVRETLKQTEPTVIPWSMFTKSDGQRFDIDTHAPKTILVNQCDGQRSRYATFSS